MIFTPYSNLKKKVNKNPDLLQIRHEFINFNFLAS